MMHGLLTLAQKCWQYHQKKARVLGYAIDLLCRLSLWDLHQAHSPMRLCQVVNSSHGSMCKRYAVAFPGYIKFCGHCPCAKEQLIYTYVHLPLHLQNVHIESHVGWGDWETWTKLLSALRLK